MQQERYDHWIGGQSVPPETGSYFAVSNPLEDTKLAEAAAGSVD